jgi:hypothetical protein
MASPTRHPTGEEGKYREQKERDSKANHGIPRRVHHHADGEVARYDNQKQARSEASHVDHPLWFDIQIIMPSTRILAFFNPASIGAKDVGLVSAAPVGAPERWVEPGPGRLLT